MELKVNCGCGQKYKFDVEPTNGQMPFAVNCPSCGVDGTPVANQMLAEHFINNPPAPVPPPPPPAPGGLRINRPAPAPTPPPLPPGAAMASSSTAVPPPMAGRVPAPALKPLTQTPTGTPKDFSLGLGTLGAFLGSAVGGGLMYGFYALAGFRFPLTGWGIGLLAGIGARWLARGRDSTLGAISAVIAVITIGGVYFLMYAGFPPLLIISVGVGGYLAYRLAS
jgi:hypothetical protein